MATTEARQVIARSRSAYAACTTYEDDGTIDTAFRGETVFTKQTEFHTAFAGPNALRLAYRELPGKYHGEMLTQVIVDDAGARSIGPWGTTPESLDSMEGVIVAMAGVSQGLSRAILPLLPTGATLNGKWSMLDYSSPVAAGVDDVDGASCDVLEATAPDGAEHVRIWIGRRDSLIRRFTEDLVESPEQVRALRVATAELDREAGVPTLDVPGIEAGALSVFTITTFHPRCGRPIDRDTLRLTDGSL